MVSLPFIPVTFIEYTPDNTLSKFPKVTVRVPFSLKEVSDKFTVAFVGCPSTEKVVVPPIICKKLKSKKSVLVHDILLFSLVDKAIPEEIPVIINDTFCDSPSKVPLCVIVMVYSPDAPSTSTLS